MRKKDEVAATLKLLCRSSKQGFDIMDILLEVMEACTQYVCAGPYIHFQTHHMCTVLLILTSETEYPSKVIGFDM